MSNEIPRLRLSVLGMVAVALFAALFARLYDLQVVGASDFQVQAEANRVREVLVPAPRGRIFDRNGKVIVDNRIDVVVAVDRSGFNQLEEEKGTELLTRLAGELVKVGKQIDAEGLRTRINNQKFSRYAPVPVAQGVPEELKIYLEEHAAEYPSVIVQRTAVRHYPYGPLAANVVGYTAKINEDELAVAEESGTPKPYSLNDDIGRTGVERAYEQDLRGTPGKREIEVDADGDPVRVISETLPKPGSDLTLTLDIDIQAVAQQRLEQGLEAARQRPPRPGNAPNQGQRGAVVVEDPNNGQVLAMASYPTYDVSRFVDGIDNAEWAYLQDPANEYPLNNWAMQGLWASGSTFKLFVGYAALKSGLMSADTVFFDRGGYQIPGCTGAKCFRSNAGSSAYGAIRIDEALTVSSDAYFYNVGAQFYLQQERFGGEEAMQQYIRDFGIGEETGIPLTEEVAGRLPTPQWRREYCAQQDCDPDWHAGDNVNLAVGQGDMVLTPLQLANGYATFANGGTRYQPQIAASIDPPGDDTAPTLVAPVVAGRVDLPPEIRQPLLDGLANVPISGTAVSAFNGFDLEAFPIAGKTGTAQVQDKADSAVFSAFGPVNAPRYQVTVLMEESGFGGSNAAPVARALFDVLSGAVPKPPAPLGGVGAAVGALPTVGGAYD
ncbi:MAG TPA: penicillin-binding protein 2 [Acidimicrobiales bacterium]|nr:penicillin-binding protein 2 [Acidimicrobiales bacterium]